MNVQVDLFESLDEANADPWMRESRVPLPRAQSPTKTLHSAIEDMADAVEEDGADCPCCGKFVKAYGRSMNKTMAASLIWIAQQSHNRSSGYRWVDVPNEGPAWITRSNQHTTLAWWGLIERKPNTDKNKKHSGMWRITDRGLRFAMGEVSVPKKVMTYNGDVYGYSEDHIMIGDCTESRFSYQEAMVPITGGAER